MNHQGAETEIAVRTPKAGRRLVFAAALLGGALLACRPAEAQSTGEAARRIQAALDLVKTAEQAGAVTRLPLLAFAPWAAPDLETLSEFDLPGDGVSVERQVVLARLPKPRPETPIITGSIAPTEAQRESDFFGRFAGTFSGSGEVRRRANESASQVRCTLTGEPSANGMRMSGECGAFIFSREISADIRYDAESGLYVGTYVGSAIGPARLRGRRQGDAVVLTITWPKPVNGDTTATMTIRNSGNGALAITVTDDLHAGGPSTEVTRIALNQI